MNVRTRIAPSPTGFAHIGTIYQVLFDYAFAKKHGGQFVVRIEDTDRQRFVEGAEDVVLDAIAWFGLDEDESPRKGGPYGPYRQSERLEIYIKYANELIEKGHAFYCFCTKERLEQMRADQTANKQAPTYDGHCLNIPVEEAKKRVADGESHVVRMKVPRGETIVVHDDLVGDVSFESDTIDMQVLMKADGFPTYHLAVVVDDELMKVTHIFRGREWLPSTPKHILLYKYFGRQVPTYVHLPLLLNSDRPGKLSKRYGHALVSYYQEQGFLPEAILNYLSLVVWKHPEGKEIYDLEEFVRLFEIKDITSQGPKFDLAKLTWLNGQWIRSLSDEELLNRLCGVTPLKNGVHLGNNNQDSVSKKYTICTENQVSKFLPLVKDRLTKLADFDELVRFFLVDDVVEVIRLDQPDVVDANARLWEMMRGKNLSMVDVRRVIDFVKSSIEKNSEFDVHVLETEWREKFGEMGYKIGDAFMVVRVALTGRTATPPLTEVMEVLGKDQVLHRLNVVAA